MAREQAHPQEDVVARVVTGRKHPLPKLFAFVRAMPYRFPGLRDARYTLEHG